MDNAVSGSQKTRKWALSLPDHLGALGRRGAWIAGVMFWILIALTLAFQIAEGERWRDKVVNLDPLFGQYGLVILNEGIFFGVSPTTQSAVKGGIQYNDTILEVNGENYAKYSDDILAEYMTAEQVARLIRDADGKTITLTVQSSDESAEELHDIENGVGTEDKQYWRFVELDAARESLTTSLRSFEITKRYILKASEWIVALLMILAAIFLWFKCRRDLVSVLIAASIAIAGAYVGTGNLTITVNPDYLFVYRSLQDIGTTILIVALPALPDGRYSLAYSKWIGFVAITVFVVRYLSLGSFLVLSLYYGKTDTADLIPLIGMKNFNLISNVRHEIAENLFNIMNGLLLVAVVMAFVKYSRIPAGPERQQAKFIGVGLIAGFMMISLGYLWRISFTYLNLDDKASIAIGYVISIIGSAAPLIMVSGLIASQLKYRLNDADSFISRAAAYGLVTAIITTVWGSLTTWMSGALASIGGTASATGISTVLAAAVFVPARKRMLDWTEKKFQPALVRMRSLPAKIRSLAHDHDPTEIAKATLAATRMGIGADYGAIVLCVGNGHLVIAADNVSESEVDGYLAQGQHDSFDGPKFAAKVDLTDLIGPVGLVLLGPRSDGAGYSSDEKEALELIRTPLSEALRATSRRASRNTNIANILSNLEARIAAMETKPGLSAT